MPIRNRGGIWHYRVRVHGHEYSGSTGLAATERNRIAAQRAEAEARRLVLSGRSAELRLQVKPFSEAASMFLDWARGEYRAHPATAQRLATSFASLTAFFKGRAVSSITGGDIEDYKGWRRTVHEVREITLRHDLHALSKFYGYALKHHWASRNPVDDVDIPSEKDAVRIHVLTTAEESVYFEAAARRFPSLYDVGRLMLLQGCRPEELMALEQSSVDLVRGTLTIRAGKTTAAKRTLLLVAESREILARRLSTPGKWVFPSPKRPGQPLTKLNGAHDKVLTDTGLAFVLYDFRHTFATRAAARGVPLPSLAAILGHNNLRSVHKYVHPSQAHLDEAMRMLDVPTQLIEERKERVM
jgi:integrase